MMIQVNKWGLLCVVCGTFCRVLSEEKREKKQKRTETKKGERGLFTHPQDSEEMTKSFGRY